MRIRVHLLEDEKGVEREYYWVGMLKIRLIPVQRNIRSLGDRELRPNVPELFDVTGPAPKGLPEAVRYLKGCN
jgi:hypothetical protein